MVFRPGAKNWVTSVCRRTLMQQGQKTEAEKSKTLKLEGWMDIKLLSQQGHSIRAIARIVGSSRNTVRRVLRGKAPEPFKIVERSSKLDEYKGYLAKRYKECALSCEKLLEEIRSLGACFAREEDAASREGNKSHTLHRLCRRGCSNSGVPSEIRHSPIPFYTCAGFQAGDSCGVRV